MLLPRIKRLRQTLSLDAAFLWWRSVCLCIISLMEPLEEICEKFKTFDHNAGNKWWPTIKSDNYCSVYCSCFCTLYPSMTDPLHHYMMTRTFSCPSPFGCLTSIGSNHGQCCAVYLSAQSPSTIFLASLPQGFPWHFTVRYSIPHPL